MKPVPAGRALAGPLAALAAATAGLCVVLALWVDRPVVLWLAASTDPGIREAFRIITLLGTATPYIVTLLAAAALAVGLSRLARFRAVRTGLLVHAWNCWFVVLSCVISGAAHHALKVMVGRYRPRYLFSEDLYGFAPFTFDIARNSFPSGHTQTIVSVCLALYLVYPRFAAAYVLLALLVASSRVVVLAHFPGDVLAGAVLAACVTILLKRHYRDPRVRSLLNRDKPQG